jgi:DNA mismatch repair protein MutS2
MVTKMQFMSDLDKIKLRLNQVHEFKQILLLQEIPEIKDFHDLYPYLEEAKPQGSFLSAESFVVIRNTIQAASALLIFLQQNKEESPGLYAITRGLKTDQSLLSQINRAIGIEGDILDTASAELKAIRADLKKEEGSLRNIINNIFRKAKKEGWVPAGMSIGVRDGRMVIPISAAYKRQITGFIHDESSTGQIVYLEPAEVLDANNRQRELRQAEKRAVVRILLSLTDYFRQESSVIIKQLNFLAVTDFIWAKAQLAVLLTANLPDISSENTVSLKKARHPQLIRAFAATKRAVVAQDFILDKSNRIMLISGPNAGGKSVALKTIGVNQFMVQTGLLPCSDPDSTFRIFDSMFIDIGDEQSIDNDLSTYSSHLQNMRIMLKHTNESSLILIDEFGTGTDPQFGAAIAEAMLAQFVQKGCYGVITTHYSNLKSYAESHEGCVNAAMKFDMVNLEPLYQLKIGRPGSSFALEIAQKSGIPGDVIKSAKIHVGDDQIETEKLLNKLERRQQILLKDSADLRKKENEVKRLEQDYRQLKEELDVNKSAILEQARQEAEALLSKTNREIEKTIRHIRENKAEKQETKKVRAELAEYAKMVKRPGKRKRKTPLDVIGGELRKGDFAIVRDSGVQVEIEEIKGKSARVSMGELQSVIKLDKLSKVSRSKAQGQSKSQNRSRQGLDMNLKMVEFSPVLDVRGKRADEVINELRSLIDHALMLGQTRLKIIHGKGTGILRSVIREHLNEYDFITAVSDEHLDRGGDGVTLVNLK